MTELVPTLLMYAALFAGMGLAYRVWREWHRTYVRRNDVLDKLQSLDRALETRMGVLQTSLSEHTVKLLVLEDVTRPIGDLTTQATRVGNTVDELDRRLANLLSNHEKHVSRVGQYIEATDKKLEDMATKWIAEVETFKTGQTAAYIDQTKQGRPRFRP